MGGGYGSELGLGSILLKLWQRGQLIPTQNYTCVTFPFCDPHGVFILGLPSNLCLLVVQQDSNSFRMNF